MAEELLSLKWNNHQAHFVDILTFLREQEIFVDATLACGGKLYPAHKFVLSTCSDYFKQMFTKNPNKHPIVFMKDVSCRDLEALLDFMYNGEVNVPQSSLGSLIKTAEGLQIKGLAVPDDPPVSKKDGSKEKKDKLHLDQYLSPPPKRLKVRERSPGLTSSASLLSNAVHSQSRTKSPPPLTNSNTGCSSLGLPIEASVDEDSRTSAQSGLSEHSHSLTTKPNMNSIGQSNDESADNCDKVLHSRTSDEPSPGPSGLHKGHSKEEELDIKQEDVVDLGEEDGEWGTTEGDIDGGGDASLGSDNAHFSDPLLPPGDSSLPSAGDHAMWLGASEASSTSPTYERKYPPELEDLIVPPKSSNMAETKPFFLNQLGSLSYSQWIQAIRNSLASDIWTCSICKKMFGTRYYYERHLKCHFNEKEQCPYCPFRSTYKWNLKSHIRNRHKCKDSED